MNLEDLIRETWSALTANRGRSALTILGIVIGIGAVITMNAIIGGVSEVQARVLGANASRIVNISIKGLDGFGEDDVDALMQNVRGYDYIVTKTSEARPSVSTDAKKLDGTIVGATSNYFQSHAYEVLAGELYGKDEEDMASRVAVLSETTVKLLWGCSNAEAVGKALRIDGDMYRVVAVTDKINSWEEYMPDTAFAVVPYSTACVRITGDTSIGQMEGMTSAGFDIDTVMSDTESYLAQRYRLSAGSEDEESARKVTIDSNKSTIESLNASMSSFQSIMVTVSGISLLVGGIGIMNMMLTNVTERIREIGLRKALGAKRADIISQFILESVCLCLTGGIIGVVMGIAGAFGLSGFVVSGMSDMLMGSADGFTPVIDATSIVNAVLVCTVTGLVFGWYPARRAAKLDPVESLNHQ